MAASHFRAEQLPQDCLDVEEIGIPCGKLSELFDYGVADFGHRVGVSAIDGPLHRWGTPSKYLSARFPPCAVIKRVVSEF
jgi:hypothetical protein